MHRHALTDEPWARLESLLSRRAEGRQVTRGDGLFVDAVIHRAKTGIPWGDRPERFGPWKSVYNQFRNWAAKEVWAQVIGELRIEADEDVIGSIADGTTLRAHQDA